MSADLNAETDDAGGRDPASPALPDPATFLSGESGAVAGVRLTATRTLADAFSEIAALITRNDRRLDQLATEQSRRRVLVLSIYRPGSRLPSQVGNLRSRLHDVHLAFGATEAPDLALVKSTALSGLSGGKFPNLNRLLTAAPPVRDFDWLIVVDDDVILPRLFLDRFVAVCERLELDLAQPAQTQRSHAGWRVTRRRSFSLARQTSFVEIGPVTAFSARAASVLTPFPELRYGWGLDSHWGAVGRAHGWRLGIVDALPVRHESQQVASTYKREEAIEEARRFLAPRSYIRTDDAQRTLDTYRRLPA